MKERDVSKPHGREHIVKIRLLEMIKMGSNAYDIIYELAQWLAEASSEPDFARQVLRELRTQYGYVDGDRKLLADELADVEARLARLKTAYEKAEFPEDDLRRVQSAIFMHQDRIAKLKERIAQPAA